MSYSEAFEDAHFLRHPVQLQLEADARRRAFRSSIAEQAKIAANPQRALPAPVALPMLKIAGMIMGVHISPDDYHRCTHEELRGLLGERDETIRQLRERLAPWASIPKCLGLSRQRSEILAVLLARAPQFIQPDRISTLITTRWGDGANCTNVIITQICYLRRILASKDILIASGKRRGYALPAESASTLRAMIAAEAEMAAA